MGEAGDDELAERADLVSFALERLGAALFVQDHVTGEHRWSDGLFVMLGFAPQGFEVNNEAFLSRVHPDDLGALLPRPRPPALAPESGLRGSGGRGR